MKIFIASPLFNPQQHLILDGIEQLLTQSGFDFYSARHDSEPFVPKGEDKKKADAWQGVFDNNEQGLRECDIMLAVLNYALPPDIWMGLLKQSSSPELGAMRLYDASQNLQFNFNPKELPDSGTVWETGYFRALNKLVVGFHPEKRGDHLNVMLTHGCDALISGWESLEGFLQKPDNPLSMDYTDSFATRLEQCENGYKIASHFSWIYCERWGAQVGDGE